MKKITTKEYYPYNSFILKGVNSFRPKELKLLPQLYPEYTSDFLLTEATLKYRILLIFKTNKTHGSERTTSRKYLASRHHCHCEQTHSA